MSQELEKELASKEEELNVLRQDVRKLKRKLKISPYCCRTAESRNGWGHDDDCPNWVMVD